MNTNNMYHSGFPTPTFNPTPLLAPAQSTATPSTPAKLDKSNWPQILKALILQVSPFHPELIDPPSTKFPLGMKQALKALEDIQTFQITNKENTLQTIETQLGQMAACLDFWGPRDTPQSHMEYDIIMKIHYMTGQFQLFLTQRPQLFSGLLKPPPSGTVDTVKYRDIFNPIQGKASAKDVVKVWNSLTIQGTTERWSFRGFKMALIMMVDFDIAQSIEDRDNLSATELTEYIQSTYGPMAMGVAQQQLLTLTRAQHEPLSVAISRGMALITQVSHQWPHQNREWTIRTKQQELLVQLIHPQLTTQVKQRCESITKSGLNWDFASLIQEFQQLELTHQFDIDERGAAINVKAAYVQKPRKNDLKGVIRSRGTSPSSGPSVSRIMDTIKTLPLPEQVDALKNQLYQAVKHHIPSHSSAPVVPMDTSGHPADALMQFNTKDAYLYPCRKCSNACVRCYCETNKALEEQGRRPRPNSRSSDRGYGYRSRPGSRSREDRDYQRESRPRSRNDRGYPGPRRSSSHDDRSYHNERTSRSHQSSYNYPSRRSDSREDPRNRPYRQSPSPYQGYNPDHMERYHDSRPPRSQYQDNRQYRDSGSQQYYNGPKHHTADHRGPSSHQYYNDNQHASTAHRGSQDYATGPHRPVVGRPPTQRRPPSPHPRSLTPHPKNGIYTAPVHTSAIIHPEDEVMDDSMQPSSAVNYMDTLEDHLN